MGCCLPIEQHFLLLCASSNINILIINGSNFHLFKQFYLQKPFKVLCWYDSPITGKKMSIFSPQVPYETKSPRIKLVPMFKTRLSSISFIQFLHPIKNSRSFENQQKPQSGASAFKANPMGKSVIQAFR